MMSSCTTYKSSIINLPVVWLWRRFWVRKFNNDQSGDDDIFDNGWLFLSIKLTYAIQYLFKSLKIHHSIWYPDIFSYFPISLLIRGFNFNFSRYFLIIFWHSSQSDNVWSSSSSCPHFRSSYIFSNFYFFYASCFLSLLRLLPSLEFEFEEDRRRELVCLPLEEYPFSDDRLSCRWAARKSDSIFLCVS